MGYEKQHQATWMEISCVILYPVWKCIHILEMAIQPSPVLVEVLFISDMLSCQQQAEWVTADQ